MDERRIFYRAAIIVGLLLPLQLAHGAAAPMKVTLHIPSKSLSLMATGAYSPFFIRTEFRHAPRDTDVFSQRSIDPARSNFELRADQRGAPAADFGI